MNTAILLLIFLASFLISRLAKRSPRLSDVLMSAIILVAGTVFFLTEPDKSIGIMWLSIGLIVTLYRIAYYRPALRRPFLNILIASGLLYSMIYAWHLVLVLRSYDLTHTIGRIGPLELFGLEGRLMPNGFMFTGPLLPGTLIYVGIWVLVALVIAAVIGRSSAAK